MAKRNFWRLHVRPRLRRTVRRIGSKRLRWFSMALVVFIAFCIPTAIMVLGDRQYQLNSQIKDLVGTTNPNLAAKLSYDKETASWQFNKDEMPSDAPQAAMPTPETLKAKLGGEGKKDESLYSVNMPEQGSKGITYYDTTTDLSFSMVPDFKVRDGRAVDGQIVYPFGKGGKIVYTAKGNGMKEDIVLTKNVGNDLQFDYTLNLPDTLEAKLLDDGGLGVYSPDPILFGDISFGTDMDREKIESARQSAAKDHLLFAIPAPIIKQTGDGAMQASAHFELDGDTLRVVAENMDSLNYPVTVDPSVVVTSTSDFTTGNEEDNIEFGTGQLSRGKLTGGAIGAYGSTGAGSYTARFLTAVVAYNGYLYVIGGDTYNIVSYAPINSNGTIGTWGSTTNIGANRAYPGAVAYNGYMYVFGGWTSGTSPLGDVKYAPINSSNGTIGTWQTSANAMATASCRFGYAVYNGYLYAVGGATGTVSSSTCGNGSTTKTNTTQYAPIKANGDVGTWTTSGTTFSNNRMSPGVVAYNGYLYLIGGTVDGSTSYNTTHYAAIKSDGDIGAWVAASNNLANTKYRFGMTVYNGYLYVSGGSSVDTATYYSQLLANGDIGPWVSTSAMSTGRYGHGIAAYNGYLYYSSGVSSAPALLNDTGYALIEQPGSARAYTNANTFTTTRRGVDVVAYNGYIYVFGGDNGSTPVSSIYKATINTSGTVGTYTATGVTAMPATLTFMSAVAYNGYMYVLGGCTSAYSSCSTNSNNVTTVYKSAISASDGTLGSWSSETGFSTARYGQSAVAYNGYLYVMGGLNGTTFQNDIQYHAIGAAGAISGAWSTSSQTISTARAYFGATTYGGKLYVAGGCSAGALTCTSSQNDIQYGTFGSGGDLTGALTTNGTTFANTRGGFDIVIYGGYLYAIGGWDGTTYYNDTQFAKVGTDGSVGSFTATVAFANARYGHGAAVYNNILYVAGGYNGTTYYNSTQYAPIQNGGGGATGTYTASGNVLPDERNNHSTVAYKGYLYVSGGEDSSSAYQDEVYYAALGTDGTVGTWNTTTALTSVRTAHKMLAYNDRMYIIGGRDNSSNLSHVEYAPINSDGTLGSWDATSSFNTARRSHGAAIYNGYIYVAGGYTSTELDSVQYAEIATDGTIGGWSSTDVLPEELTGLSLVASGGYLYALGGDGGGSGPSNAVYYADLTGNGSIGTWAATTSFSFPRYAQTAFSYNGYLYVQGGYNGSTYFSDMQYAPINANGTLGNWNQTVGLSSARSALSTAAYNGYIYATGGTTSGTVAIDEVRHAPLTSMSRKGSYSKLINLGALYNLNSFEYGGTLRNGMASIDYKIASTNGTLGTLKSAAGANVSTICATPPAVYYLWVLVSLDDTANASFPDADASASTLTSLTVNYGAGRATPQQRLMHGKYFQDEALQPLDTCG